MKDIVSKFSLYDILAMVIPGGAILWGISLSGYRFFQITDKALFWIVSLVFSYLIGLINHMLTSYIWSCFRNNSAMINEAKQYVYNYNKMASLKQSPIYCTIILGNLLVLLMIYLLYEVIFRIDVIQHYHIIALICFIVTTLCLYILIHNNQDQVVVDKKYYKAYYYVLKNRYSNDIPIMESQVAFIQNMLIPILMFLFLPWEIYGLMQVIIVIMIPLLVWAIFHIQMKIYRRVWEDNLYLQEMLSKPNKPIHGKIIGSVS